MTAIQIQKLQSEQRLCRRVLVLLIFCLLNSFGACRSESNSVHETEEPTQNDFYTHTVVVMPVVESNFTLASTFGPRLKTSDHNRYDFHRGLDIVGERDDSVFAVADGEIVRVYDEGSAAYPNLGRVVIVEHTEVTDFVFQGTNISKYYSLYGHLDGFSIVAQSVLDDDLPQTIVAGDELGQIGDSGSTDLVHLHFEVRLETTCSLEYQLANPSLECANLGFDPHVHPLDLFVEAPDTNDVYMLSLTEDQNALHIAATAERPYFNIDGVTIAIFADAGEETLTYEQTLSFNTRDGFDATSTDALDAAELSPITVLPQRLGASATQYEIQFEVDLQDLSESHYAVVQLNTTRGVVQTSRLEF